MGTTLRKIGGSVVLKIPAGVLSDLHLRAGSVVDVGVEDGRLVAAPQTPRYTMSKLLADSDYTDQPDAEREWVDAAETGRELL